MKDWSLIAKAGGLDIPAKDLDRIAATLTTLDQAFRPLVAKLTPAMDPSLVFRAGEESS